MTEQNESKVEYHVVIEDAKGHTDGIAHFIYSDWGSASTKAQQMTAYHRQTYAVHAVLFSPRYNFPQRIGKVSKPYNPPMIANNRPNDRTLKAMVVKILQQALIDDAVTVEDIYNIGAELDDDYDAAVVEVQDLADLHVAGSDKLSQMVEAYWTASVE